MKRKFFTAKDILVFVGFLLFLIGMTSISLSLIGLKYSFLVWIDKNPQLGFLAKVGMIIAGIILVVLARTDWNQEQD